MALSSKLFRMIRSLTSRCYSSPVLKGGKLAKTDTFSTPFLDLEKKLEELPKLQENIDRRQLELDTVKMKSTWDLLKNLRATKLQLERRKLEIMGHMQDLKKIGEDAEATKEIAKLKVELGVVRDDLRTLMKSFWDIEEKVHVSGLMIPNELHADTPNGEDRVVHEFGTIPRVIKPCSHLEIGSRLDLIDYRDPSCFYLKNEAALFEVSSAYYFADSLKRRDFVAFCNPDCAKGALVDGCTGNSTQSESVFIIKENVQRTDRNRNYNLHLVGGASIYPFCAFHTKQVVSFPSLPLKYFTVGRQYSPSSLDSKHGLYETWQRTTNEIFILTPDDHNEMMSAFKETLGTIISLYEKLNHHFRVVYMKASSLESWESLRASFQMYSCHERKYVEIGKISISDSYICQRLSMKYQMSEKDCQERFMKMISGTAVDITKLLACILEQRNNSGEKFSMPDCLRSHWSV